MKPLKRCANGCDAHVCPPSAELKRLQAVEAAARSWHIKESRTIDMSEVAAKERWHREAIKMLEEVLAGRKPGETP